MKAYDVIIIGGGITGAGTARDCAIRGLRTLLIEKNDIATGATGRNHGLLHSGARYAVNDQESAKECISENMILKRIAASYIEDTGGLFVTLPEDEEQGYGIEYQSKFVKACQKAGIEAEIISPTKALRMEPSVNPAITGAVMVPDGSVDPFRLCSANILDAKIHGADILLHTQFIDFIKEGDAIKGVQVCDMETGTQSDYYAAVTVNASGIWGEAIAAKAGAAIKMYPAKGSLLVFGHRVNGMVINRCRNSADGDILVPGDTVSIIGTTSSKISFEECDNVNATRSEVEILLKEGCVICPSLANTRILRAYSGVRPLVAASEDGTGRNISRGIVCLDHEERDGIKGFITITGGKLMTYRLMAEMATDLVCKKIAHDEVGLTAILPLVGCEKGITKLLINQTQGQKAAACRLGTKVAEIDYSNEKDKELVCECEQVTLGEIKYAVRELNVRKLEDLRRRTRVGMGTCQGTFCIYKAAKALAEAIGTPQNARELAVEYLNERWKGMIPVAWGDTIREMEFSQRVYKEGLPYTYEI